MDPGPPNCPDTPESLALSNDLILNAILNNLSTSSLLNCRLTNPKWNKTASLILRRRHLCIKISSLKAQNIKKLRKLLSQKGDYEFPASGLKFNVSTKNNAAVNLETANVDQFLTEIGSIFTYIHVEHLYLKDDFQMMKLLHNYFPKMEVLVLKFFAARKTGSDEIAHYGVHLPQIRRIKFEEDYEVSPQNLRTLLACGTRNVEAIEGLGPSLNDYGSDMWRLLIGLEKRNKLGVVTSIILKADALFGLLHVEDFLTSQPLSLTELTLEGRTGDDVWDEFMKCVMALLIASANTLKKLTFARLTIPWEHIPVVFTKLHTLELGSVKDRENEITSVDFGCTEGKKFPALRKISLALPAPRDSINMVEISTMTGRAEVLEDLYWEPGTVWKSVDTIELYDHFSPDGLQYLAKVFPNVTQVIISMTLAGFVSHDTEARKPSHVWRVREFRNLRKLVIQDFPCDENSYLYVDTFLTGIPPASCNKLRKMPKQQLDPFLDKVFRPYGGLRKLKGSGLRELEISHRFDSHLIQQDSFMSLVSVWYGLELIPGLQTTLKIPFKAKADLKQALDHLQPHVAVEYHWK